MAVNKKLRKFKIFLASSNELKEEREEFRNYIATLNDRFIDNKIYLEIVQWENFLDAISDTRLQNEYNEALKKVDIALCLFFTKVGKYSEEEFDTAYKAFKATGKPKIWTYFKDASISTGAITKEINTLLKFKEKIGKYGHFFTNYTSTADLHNKFRGQLDILIPEFMFPVKRKKTQEGQTENSVTQPANNNNAYDDSGINKIETLLDEPTENNIKAAIDLLATLTRNTNIANFILPLRADFIQYKEDKLAGYNMNGRLNILLVRFRQIINEFKNLNP